MISFTSKRKYLVTCALPYVNNVPHLGNIVPILSADIYARFLRNQGKNTIYICATDDHGTRTEIEAEKRGVSPEKYNKEMHRKIKKIFNWFNIQFDNFGRTHSKYNEKITQNAFLKLDKNGYVFDKEITQLFCKKCKRFLPDTFVRGKCPKCGFEEAKGDQCDNCGALLNPEDLINPKCNECGSRPEVKKTRHLFLDLEKLSLKIEKWVKSKKHWKGMVKNLPLAWIKEGLKARCITRDLKYGIPVPKKGFKDKVFYVWFDAPFGYVASTAEWAKKKKKNWKNWWFKDNVEYTQFMGKDNVPFHTLIWPGSLLGSKDGWHTVDNLKANEYLNYKGGQFSKSQNCGVFGDDAKNLEFPADMWRFYITMNLPEHNDTNFSWSDFRDIVNKELIANLGNFVNRTISFTKKNFGRAPKEKPDKKGKEVLKKAEKFRKQSDSAMEEIEIRKALKMALRISDIGNQYFQSEEPWKSVKKNKKKCEKTLSTCFELLKMISEVFEPFMPETAQKIKKQVKIKDVGLLFKKIDDKRIKELDEEFSGKKSSISRAKKLKVKPMIEFGDFEKVDIRIGKIVEAEEVPKSEKMIKMQVDFGGEKRQVLAGIKKWYQPKELIGKKASFVVNLKPVKLMGYDSEAMIMAAEKGKKVKFLTPESDIEEGAKIH